MDFSLLAHAIFQQIKETARSYCSTFEVLCGCLHSLDFLFFYNAFGWRCGGVK